MCHKSTKTKKWQELEDCHLTGIHCRMLRVKSDCPMLDPICLVPMESRDWDNYGNIDIYVIKLQHIHRICHWILASLFHLTKFCQFYSSFPEKSIYYSNIPYANPLSVIHHWKATGMAVFLPHNPYIFHAYLNPSEYFLHVVFKLVQYLTPYHTLFTWQVPIASWLLLSTQNAS